MEEEEEEEEEDVLVNSQCPPSEEQELFGPEPIDPEAQEVRGHCVRRSRNGSVPARAPITAAGKTRGGRGYSWGATRSANRRVTPDSCPVYKHLSVRPARLEPGEETG
ncbi:unnamed protein product [Arctogadus glacialis]